MDKTLTPEHHWTGKKPDPNKYFGFIYIITNNINDKKYIGKKQYHRWSKNKKIGESNWRFYKSSSKYVHEDIKKYGIENFEFEIFRNVKTRGGLVYLEANYQHKWDVLTDRIVDTDERSWYNANIQAIKFIPKEY